MSGRLLAINPVDHPGGAEMTVLRLLAGLRQRGWEVTATTPGHGVLHDAILAAGHDWHPLGVGGLGRREGSVAVLNWPRARELVRGFDVVYLNGGVCGRMLPVTGQAPMKVLHIHDIVGLMTPLWRRADLVLADSRAVADRLRTLDDRLDVEVAYPPVDLDPPPAPRLWPDDGLPVIGFVGWIEPRKGPSDLVHAAPAIRRGAPNARIVIVGNPPPFDPIYAARVLASPEVEHYPWTPNAPGLMRHMDVLVLPSYREPFGAVVADAMAVGTPVVATLVDGLPEVVRDGVSGRLVVPGDPDALAAAVLEVLARREEMGTAARREAHRFRTDAHVETVERLLLRGAAAA
jgi:glycosyltransferase involved in cell wall biosynthesis